MWPQTYPPPVHSWHGTRVKLVQTAQSDASLLLLANLSGYGQIVVVRSYIGMVTWDLCVVFLWKIASSGGGGGGR